MEELPEPLKSILRGYLHVEWVEVHELADDVTRRNRKYDVDLLQQQFKDLLAGTDDFHAAVNEITRNEFEDDAEAREWLNEVYRRVFVDPN